jgi:multicomponent Na+:H+ antiporter subunit E
MLYLHVLDAVEPDDLARAVQDVLDAEARVIRAFGSAAEIAALEAGATVIEPPVGPGPAEGGRHG